MKRNEIRKKNFQQFFDSFLEQKYFSHNDESQNFLRKSNFDENNNFIENSYIEIDLMKNFYDEINYMICFNCTRRMTKFKSIILNSTR